jgi:protein-L-isoaspartate(D-aspartate) O-methyltransferase
MLELLRDRGIRDEAVLTAMREVPREEFVPAAIRGRAWDDSALPLEHGQTISQPLIVAWMTELLELAGDETVLDVGTGSGYQLAILCRLARRVVSIERLPQLSATAGERLAALGITNATLVIGDGTLGWPELAPYDAILVAAAAPEMPQPLYDQLALGGRLVLPVGSRESQEMQRIRKTAAGPVVESLGGCRFVPLIGTAGWRDG